VSRSACVESEQLPCNRYLQTFLTFLKQERGFADSTIINRIRSLTPFLGWLAGRGTTLSEVTPGHHFRILHHRRWKRTSISFTRAVSALVLSLCPQSGLVSGRHCRIYRCAAPLYPRKSSARANVGRGEAAA
jgi:hypothetical protein